jgi:hypothetical protein
MEFTDKEGITLAMERAAEMESATVKPLFHAALMKRLRKQQRGFGENTEASPKAEE